MSHVEAECRFVEAERHAKAKLASMLCVRRSQTRADVNIEAERRRGIACRGFTANVGVQPRDKFGRTQLYLVL
ncbi:hypothetical protein E2562_013263 [Oryza meyeriana var. granulata]|uniref:Uncharacterized protein n=1 Tax=Oryza meyeriana var. granulata TaxID=110450 RepID=A0A6G1D392_9ORYZ|nr:hypothetical protein E2562_013263 [Oryza meyeriana var. granulata]